jgi:hypothetical protein
LLPSLEKYFLTTTLWARPIDHRTQVEMIPGHDHDIKIPRSVEDPNRAAATNNAARPREAVARSVPSQFGSKAGFSGGRSNQGGNL